MKAAIRVRMNERLDEVAALVWTAVKNRDYSWSVRQLVLEELFLRCHLIRYDGLFDKRRYNEHRHEMKNFALQYGIKLRPEYKRT